MSFGCSVNVMKRKLALYCQLQKARRSSLHSITSEPDAILVNAPTLGGWYLLQGKAVAISCTTDIYALLFSGLSRRESERGEIGVARMRVFQRSMTEALRRVRETTANDRLLHFMAQPLYVEKHGEFGVTSQFVIEVQPFFIRYSHSSNTRFNALRRRYDRSR